MLATLIDLIPYAVIVGIGLGIEAATQETACVTDTSEYNIGTVCASGNSMLGMSIVRQIAHTLDGALCYVGYLFPLWDAKRQTFAEKIMTTVCVPIT